MIGWIQIDGRRPDGYQSVPDGQCMMEGQMPEDSPPEGEFLADCHARLAFDLIANRWNAVVVWALREGPQRPVHLRRRIGGISTKVLTETLRRLEYNGLVSRHTYREAPPRVEYRLTELGTSLVGPIEEFGEWAHHHGDEVMQAQDRAETASA